MQKLFNEIYNKFGSNFFVATFVALLIISIYLFLYLIAEKNKVVDIERECSEKIQSIKNEQIRELQSKLKKLDSLMLVKKIK